MILDTQVAGPSLYTGFVVLVEALFEFGQLKSPIDFFPCIELAIFSVMVIWMLGEFSVVRRQLSSANKELKDLEVNSGSSGETVEKISNLFQKPISLNATASIRVNFFKQETSLGHIWHEFNESLVVSVDADSGKKSYRNTLDAHHFFKTDTICDHLLLFEAVPGVLTGAAILGTFAGIIYGIQESGLATAIQRSGSVEGAELFGRSIGMFLSALGDAFAASFWGLGLALLFTMIERSCVSQLERALGNFNQFVNKIFPRQTPEQLLIDLSASNDRQVASMERLVREIPKQIVQSLVEGGVSNVEIDAGIQKGIQAGFQGLLERLRQINDFHDKYYSGVQSVVEQLSTVKDSIGAFSEAQRSISENSESASVRLNSASVSFQEAATSTQNALASLEEQISAMAEAERAIGDRTASIVDAGKGLGDELREAAQQFASKSEQLVTVAEKTSQGLATGFGQIDGHMANAVTELGKSIGSLGAFLEVLIEKIERVETGLETKAEVANVASLESAIKKMSSQKEPVEQN